MRILFIGDIVGNPGMNMVRRAVPYLRRHHRVDVVIADAENAAGGSGLTEKQFRRLRSSGVDLVTLGDHAFRKNEIYHTLRQEASICRPANYPIDSPGRGHALFESPSGVVVGVFTVLGRNYMRPVDCPFQASDRELTQLQGKAQVIIAEVHAEATADKYALAHHLKGRVSAVLGTHTHVQTADEQVFPPGTAFLCDVGMTGPYDSILGRRIDRVLHTARTFEPTAFDVAENDVRLGGAIVELEPSTGRAVSIERVMLRESSLPPDPPA